MKSSYFKVKPKDTGKTVYDEGMRFREGQVIKVHFADEPTNRSKKFVEYDVLARDAKGGLVTFKNCRYLQDTSGLNDYSETVLEPNEVALQGKLETSNIAANMNGTMVMLGFLDGNIDKPVILGGFPHRKNEGAKKSDGIRKKRKFRGVEVEINKDGEYIISQKGPNNSNGTRKSPNVNTEVKFDKSGNLKVSVGNAGLTAELNATSDAITYTTAGGPKVTIDGSGNIKLEANGTLININGQSGKIELTGNLVDVGAAASALAVLGPQLYAWLAGHVHQGGIITSPPIVPPPPTILSTTVKIKP